MNPRRQVGHSWVSPTALVLATIFWPDGPPPPWVDSLIRSIRFNKIASWRPVGMLTWAMRNGVLTITHVCSCASSPLKTSHRPLTLMLSPLKRARGHKNARPYVQRVPTATRRRTKRATRGAVPEGRWTAGRKADRRAGISRNRCVTYINMYYVVNELCIRRY